MKKKYFKNIRLDRYDFEYIRKQKNPSEHLRKLIKRDRKEAQAKAERA